MVDRKGIRVDSENKKRRRKEEVALESHIVQHPQTLRYTDK